MCYIGCTKAGLIERVAEDNIPVTKVLYVGPFKNMISLYYNFIYELNKIYKIDNFAAKQVGDVINISRGFHSYANPNPIIVKPNKDWITICLSVGSMFQDAVPVDRTFYSCIYKAAIADCIIPKGSHYYVNHHRECVSDAIKIINVYKIDIK